MGDVKSLDGERKKRVLSCMFCGKVPSEEHPGYSCPRIHMLYFDDDGSVYAVEFHDWQPAPDAA
jgi:hypothetical protein